MFKCGFCGREYATLPERMKCEADCLEKKRKEESIAKIEADKRKAKEIADTKKMQTAAIQNKLDTVNKDIAKYCETYGEYPSLHASLIDVYNMKESLRYNETPNDFSAEVEDALNKISLAHFVYY